MAGGRPTNYKPEYAEQARKLCKLGATNAELDEFFSAHRTEIEYLASCLLLIRSDRNAIIAARKKKTALWRKNSSTPSYRLLNAMRARVWASLKGRTDNALFSLLPYTLNELRTKLESGFVDGMSWSNYGEWHVDHIKPCAMFDLTRKDQFSECWALSNLQPLWASDNSSKGAKYVSA